ncbi:major facilitator superfamily MFS_1 [Clostridium perfringens]|uniref:Major facilitator superfamily MFS_1 n=1 Tax=Clostridium perfringens TaxID=1502 RepID=A0A2X2Y8V5_CLOPF|nr:MFS transporter [Clostridium perfringens]MBI6029295.1 MFS transporter [Clostridium perfringens]MBI6033639.1 MFS transporter [Clostridium perfringens]MBI6068702.1 MFS transporter [Clostridium perfringens]MBI6097275.1 MFS transporter [Clostridium perfringens]SQB60027.1 major facilitator superfamily MFS_1 [Clostridium perfringens]
MKNKNYYCMLLSIIINNFGDVLFDLFIIWSITRKTDNILNAVYLIGSSILFRAILSLFVGILIDHKNKKNLIIFTNISSALIVFLFFINFEFIIDRIWLSLLLILLNNINNEIFSKSYLILGSELFDKEKFIKFQSTYTIAVRIINVFGSAIVGFLIAYLSEKFIFGLDILTFFISAVLIIKVKYTYIAKESNLKGIIQILEEIKFDVKYTFKSIYKISFLKKFVMLMFILNIAYGFIPYILPLIISNNNNSSILLGGLKSAITIGEILGLFLVVKLGRYVSILFKVSMVGCAIIMFSLINISNMNIIIIIFLLYGALDSITQPLFSYTVSSIDEESRGRILGGIDTLILISPSLGMWIGTKLMNINYNVGLLFLSSIFIIALILILTSKDFNGIRISSENK